MDAHCVTIAASRLCTLLAVTTRKTRKRKFDMTNHSVANVCVW